MRWPLLASIGLSRHLVGLAIPQGRFYPPIVGSKKFAAGLATSLCMECQENESKIAAADGVFVSAKEHDNEATAPRFGRLATIKDFSWRQYRIEASLRVYRLDDPPAHFLCADGIPARGDVGGAVAGFQDFAHGGLDRGGFFFEV